MITDEKRRKVAAKLRGLKLANLTTASITTAARWRTHLASLPMTARGMRPTACDASPTS